MQNGPKTVMNTRQPNPAASFVARSRRWTRVPLEPRRRALKTRNEAMSGISRSLVMKPVGDTVGARTTTSTPNIISDRCPRTEKGRKRLCCDELLRQGAAGDPCVYRKPYRVDEVAKSPKLAQ